MVMIFAFLRLPTLFILLKNAERKSIFSANQIKPYYFLMGHNILWHYQRFTISHWIFSASTRIGFSCHHFSTCSTFVITCFTSMYHFLHCNVFMHCLFALLLIEKLSIKTYWQIQNCFNKSMISLLPTCFYNFRYFRCL